MVKKMNLNQITIKSYVQNSLAAFLLSTVSASVFAQATFLIWPIYPNIESNEKATAVWLENTGKTDAMVQVRVFKWSQKEYKDSFENQSEIIPSPPIVKIKAGEKNMLRITRAITPEANTEQAYRIIVDELPIKLEGDQTEANSKVSFQMRYSIPLFSYGKGIGSGLNEASIKDNNKNPQAKPILSYWVKKTAGQSQLFIKNSGAKFARISGIRLSENSNQLDIESMSLGYILPNSTMSFDIKNELFNQLDAANILYSQDSSGTTAKSIELKKAGS
ncbi:fimbrial chaperone protein [Acinetobacter calcoaceticus]|uniref:Fimbrial chaperone protein n=1 Tax=Acinetobacter calcoaceticus TaxID=471 RepID=A0A4R1XL82_ACICA|nr:fimbrial chaperone protein [Acinetobacter calcoaceticus]